MSQQPIDLNTFRKRKSRARVFLALEKLYAEVLTVLADDTEDINPAELEEFLVQVLADHLSGNLASPADVDTLNANYQRFDKRLRTCLRTRLSTLRNFQNCGG